MNMKSDSAEFAGTGVASDDLDLVYATRNGDLSAFEQLVGRYDCKLLRIAQHVTHNREDSQDAVQDSFMKASNIWKNSASSRNSRRGCFASRSTSP